MTMKTMRLGDVPIPVVGNPVETVRRQHIPLGLLIALLVAGCAFAATRIGPVHDAITGRAEFATAADEFVDAKAKADAKFSECQVDASYREWDVTIIGGNTAPSR